MTVDSADDVGQRLYALIAELFPICRSITGDGVRQTLRAIQRRIPLIAHEVATGTRVLDWTVPREWNVRDAYVMDSAGRRIIDFRESNLHLVSYSAPVHRRVPFSELRQHLFTLPDQPDRIPYRTSYYREDWGFCLAHRDLALFTDEAYDVVIDSTLAPGSLTYGECLLPGAVSDEVLVSAHICHPSLANDNLSGVAVAALLAEHLAGKPRHYTYRFLFIPGTIGSITWLSRNGEPVHRIRHGLVLSCLGDPGPSTYKRSRRDGGCAAIDRAAEHVLRHAGDGSTVVEFVPWGNDERQYCSPGFDLPVGALSRTPPERYPEYHTSADDLSLVTPGALADSFAKCCRIFEVLEQNGTYMNLSPMGEPQLGRRGLYHDRGGLQSQPERELALLWVLNLSDGQHSLLDIADRAGIPFAVIHAAVQDLAAAGLVAECAPWLYGTRGRRRSDQHPAPADVASAIVVPQHPLSHPIAGPASLAGEALP